MRLTAAKTAAVDAAMSLLAPLMVGSTQFMVTLNPATFIVMSAGIRDLLRQAYQKSVSDPLSAVTPAQHCCLKIPFPQTEAQVPVPLVGTSLPSITE